MISLPSNYENSSYYHYYNWNRPRFIEAFLTSKKNSWSGHTWDFRKKSWSEWLWRTQSSKTTLTLWFFIALLYTRKIMPWKGFSYICLRRASTMSNDRDVRMLQMEVAKLKKENQTLKVKVRELSCRSSFLQTKVAKLSNQIHEFVTG